MKYMMVSGSHTPLLDIAPQDSERTKNVVSALEATRARVDEFNPDLVVLFGVDHYGGHQMNCMPSFTVGVEATSLEDIGGTPGVFDVPREVAVSAVESIRRSGVDVAISYSMEVDHGFSQIAKRVLGSLTKYPVLPIFVSCIQPPFVPYARARALGEAVAEFTLTLDSYERILFVGSGGLTHNPEIFFPPIDSVGDDWKPYILHGKTQSEVSQQDWIQYEIDAHKIALDVLKDPNIQDKDFGLFDEWDKSFLNLYCKGDMSVFDSLEPETVMKDAGIGAVETLSWVAAGSAMSAVTSAVPYTSFYQLSREVGIGFGIAETKASEGSI